MSYKTITFLIGVVMLCSCTLAACPDNPQVAIGTCGDELQIDASSMQQIVTDLDKAKMACSNDKLQKVLDCIEGVITECKDVAQNEFVSQLVNVNGWKTSMKVLCDNLEYMKQNAKCMVGDNETPACIQKETTVFQTEMQVKMQVQIASGKQPSPTEMMKLSCGLVGKMLNCITAYPKKNCPKKVTDVLEDVFIGFVPPICKDELPKRDRGSYAHISSDGSGSGSVIVASAFLLLFTLFLNRNFAM